MSTFPLMAAAERQLLGASCKPLIIQANLRPDASAADLLVATSTKSFCPVACAVKKMPLQWIYV